MGGKSAFYHLPLTISQQLGYFHDEGLDVEIADFAGGARALQAVIGGTADLGAGFTSNMPTSSPRRWKRCTGRSMPCR